MSCDLFVFAGEKSGDLHAERVIASLKHLAPSLKITGVGGPRMRAQGIDCVLPMEEFQVMGFIDVFLALPKLIRQFYFVARTILKMQPKAVLFIDYPGFNLRMARHLRKRGFKGKLCHFICPSVWAWGKKRIPLMASTLDQLLTILPFEKDYFRNTSLDVAFVGHPLIHRLSTYAYTTLRFPEESKVIALFPGSRKKELLRNFPLYLTVCKRLKAKDATLFFAISVADEKYRPLIEMMIHDAGWTIGAECALIPVDQTYDLMRSAHAAIAKSGTVTLELALHAVPTVVTYAISPLDLLIARDILRIRLPFYCLVNIIGNQEIFPELFGPHFREDSLLQHALPLIDDAAHREAVRLKCGALKATLTERDASAEAAQLVLNQII